MEALLRVVEGLGYRPAEPQEGDDGSSGGSDDDGGLADRSGTVAAGLVALHALHKQLYQVRERVQVLRRFTETRDVLSKEAFEEKESLVESLSVHFNQLSEKSSTLVAQLQQPLSTSSTAEDHCLFIEPEKQTELKCLLRNIAESVAEHATYVDLLQWGQSMSAEDVQRVDRMLSNVAVSLAKCLRYSDTAWLRRETVEKLTKASSALGSTY
ncbi:hypothetical protein QOT17_015440 [Balamuthia mandrillaris]